MKSSLTAFGTYGFMCSMLATQVAIASSSGMSKSSGSIKASGAKRAPVSHHTAKRSKR